MSGARQFLSDETGSAVAEYALLMGMMAMAVVTGGKNLATSINGSFNAAAAISAAPGGLNSTIRTGNQP